MKYTVKEIADALKVDRSKVYRAIKRLKIEPDLEDGVAKYDEDNLEAIRGEIKRIESKGSRSGAGSDADRKPSSHDAEILDALKATIQTQADMIEHLKIENNELRDMLRREQEIRFGKMALEAASKPRLVDRVKSLFSGRVKAREVTDQETPPESE